MFSHLPLGEQRRSGPEASPKSLLLKPGQSGLRPPGFSALPAARLASFGFVRSSSVSSVSSNQSNDSSHSDPCRPSQRELRSVYLSLTFDRLKRVSDIKQMMFNLIKMILHICALSQIHLLISSLEVVAAPTILSYYSNGHSLPLILSFIYNKSALRAAALQNL